MGFISVDSHQFSYNVFVVWFWVEIKNKNNKKKIKKEKSVWNVVIFHLHFICLFSFFFSNSIYTPNTTLGIGME